MAKDKKEKKETKPKKAAPQKTKPEAKVEAKVEATPEAEGAVEAMAAGGLKSFKGPGLEITLDERIDFALWLNENGKYEGVIQGLEGELPLQLLDLTGNWSRLAVPVPYAD